MGTQTKIFVIILLALTASIGLVMLISIILARNQFSDEAMLFKDDTSNSPFRDTDTLRAERTEMPEETTAAHECTFEVSIIEPTCQHVGYKVFKCQCGNSYSEKNAEKVGHAYLENQRTQPTCTSEGSVEYRCACGEAYTESIEKLPHEYTSTTVLATCTEEGHIDYTCACGESYTEILSKLAHEYVEETVLPTCTAEGSRIYLCACGDTYTEVYAEKLAHSYAESERIDPTCTSEGRVSYLCACGELYTESLSKLNHSYKLKTRSATCTTEGASTYTCSCGDTYTVTIDAKGHTYTSKVTPPTCVSGGYTTHTCHCGDSYKDNYTLAIDHKWSKWIVTEKATTVKKGSQYRKCSSCAKTETQVLDKKQAVDLASITPVSMFSGVNSKAMKVINAVLKCVDDYYDTKNNDEIYIGEFEVTWMDVSIAETALAFYMGSYQSSLDCTTFYPSDENHQHLFVDLAVLRKTEKDRRIMMDEIIDIISLFEAGSDDLLIEQTFDYLASSIKYDGKQADATVALKKGRGSCNTYPVLFKIMLCQLGIESEICIGYAYNGQYHAWNRVMGAGGTYRYYDLTFYISTNSNKYYAADSLKHHIVTIERYLTSKELSGK